MGWGSFFTFLAGAAITAVSTVIQVQDAKSDAKKVNSRIDELNNLNAERRDLERSDKEAGLKASQRARLSEIRNNMAKRGLDTEGGTSKNITNVTESSLKGSLDTLNKSAGIAGKIDDTTAAIQKLQGEGPSLTSTLAGVASATAGTALASAGASGENVFDGITDLFK